tara:strand:- start:38 stop:256 length:219 start_codon:yes stop_codon:yes gene_type:complete
MADLQALQTWADERDLVVEDGLIQNAEAITRQDASQRSSLWMLRWRHRICEDTGESFDITQAGFLYRSGVSS